MDGNEYYGLPESLMVNGEEWLIRPDFRNILRIIIAMKDPELDDREKIYVCLDILYEDFRKMDQEDYEAAFNAATWFINCGDESKSSRRQQSRRKRIAGAGVSALVDLHGLLHGDRRMHILIHPAIALEAE